MTPTLNPKPEILTADRLSVAYESLRLDGPVLQRGIPLMPRRQRIPVMSALSFSIRFTSQSAMIVGPNGIGKTTLLKALAGLVPYDGEISWNGHTLPVANRGRRLRDTVAFVPHESGLFPNLTVADHLALFEKMGTRGADGVSAFCDRVLGEVGDNRSSLRFLMSRTNVGNLSGGERKVLGLLRLLYARRSLVLIDEATAGVSEHWLPAVRIIFDMLMPARIVYTDQVNRACNAALFTSQLFELSEGSLAPGRAN